MKKIKLTKEQKSEVADMLCDAVLNCTNSIVDVDTKDLDLESDNSDDLVDAACMAAEQPVIDEFIKLLEARKKHNEKFIAKIKKKYKH